MDKESKKIISKQYSDLVEKYQGGMQSLHASTSNYERKHQNLKFSYVNNVIDIEDSLLDIGCGLGDLYIYCKDKGWKGKYTGLDVSEKMVEYARMRLETDNIFEIDILDDTYDEKHDVVVSIATLQQKPIYEESSVYLKNMIDKMFSLSNKLLVFDIFSEKFADYKKDGNLYADPSELLNYCYSMTNRVVLYNDYNPYQFTMVLYKERINGWIV